MAGEARQRVRRGLDPKAASIEKTIVEPPRTPTLSDLAERVIALREPTWTGVQVAEHWRNSIKLHVVPTLGDKPIGEISTPDVLNVLLPIWTSKPVIANRVRQRLSAIFDFAIASGYREDNPASAVKAVLPQRQRNLRHQPSIPYAEVPAALSAIRDTEARSVTRWALEYLILTTCRSVEVRGATWDEIDLETRAWTIPAARMKMRSEHRVPLSDGAMAVLKAACKGAQGRGLVFPSNRAGGMLSGQGLRKLLWRAGYHGFSVHGFRASFRTWALETTDTPWAVCEAALAHNLGGGEVQAYIRGDLFLRRGTLMEDWSEYVRKG